MKDTKNVSTWMGDVPVQKPKETIDCNICGRKKVLNEDEQYVCEVCGRPKPDTHHP